MTIENKPTYFGRLELREIPSTRGKDMLEPASLSVDFPAKTNNIAVFPDANRAYYFNLAPNAGRGQFEFRLYNKDDNKSIAPTASARIENDYLTFDCTPNPQNLNQCQGKLSWKDASGTSLWGWTATSGITATYPYLPSMTYTIKKINPHFLNDDNGAFCDDYAYLEPDTSAQPHHCWSAPFTETLNSNTVHDPKVPNRGRSALSLHPDGHGIGTLGCIGIDPKFPSRAIRSNLQAFFDDFGEMKVIVQ